MLGSIVKSVLDYFSECVYKKLSVKHINSLKFFVAIHDKFYKKYTLLFFEQYLFDDINFFFKNFFLFKNNFVILETKEILKIKNFNFYIFNKEKKKGFFTKDTFSGISLENTFFFKIKTFFLNKNYFLNTIFFFRKNKVFIKSKYSKIRVFCKSIVLFSLCLNVIFLIELNFIYYNITLNIGYFIFYVYLVILLISFKYIWKYLTKIT